MKKQYKWIIGLLVTAFLFANPLTRRIVLWILPLGKGVDDFLVWAALFVAGLIFLFTKWEEINFKQKIADLQKKENRKSLQITLTVIGLIIALAIPAVRDELWQWFFFGDPIDEPIKFFSVLALVGTYIVLVWLALDKIVKIKE